MLMVEAELRFVLKKTASELGGHLLGKALPMAGQYGRICPSTHPLFLEKSRVI